VDGKVSRGGGEKVHHILKRVRPISGREGSVSQEGKYRGSKAEKRSFIFRHNFDFLEREVIERGGIVEKRRPSTLQEGDASYQKVG